MIKTVRRTSVAGEEVEIDLTDYRVDPFELIDTLDALGSADAIAAFMRAEYVRGYAGMSLACPVTVWLERETGVLPSVSIATWTPRHEMDDFCGDDQRPWFALPRHVELFVDGIDSDCYPDLARDPEELIYPAPAAS